MKLLYLCVLFIIVNGCASFVQTGGAFRLYEISDMDDFVRDHYSNTLNLASPGIACGDFKLNNNVGCFKILVNRKDGRVISLVYKEGSGESIEEIYKLESTDNFIFIEKSYQNVLINSNSLPGSERVMLLDGQPSLRLIFFGKSAVVFYWKNGRFNEIWVSD